MQRASKIAEMQLNGARITVEQRLKLHLRPPRVLVKVAKRKLPTATATAPLRSWLVRKKYRCIAGPTRGENSIMLN